MKFFIVKLFALVSILTSLQYVYSEENIATENSSADISSIVKEEIEKLTLNDSCNKVRAIQKLGEMKSDALLAILHLIELLDNKASCIVHGFDFSVKILMFNLEAMYALESITGLDFHRDKGKWAEWWRNKK